MVKKTELTKVKTKFIMYHCFITDIVFLNVSYYRLEKCNVRCLAIVIKCINAMREKINRKFIKSKKFFFVL